MRGIEHNCHEELTLLELVLQLHGELGRNLKSIRVTPLQAGVTLFLCRHADTKLTDTASALRVTLPTLSTVVKDLVRKRWVTKRRSGTDTRAVCLRLSRRGAALALQVSLSWNDANSYVACGVIGIKSSRNFWISEIHDIVSTLTPLFRTPALCHLIFFDNPHRRGPPRMRGYP